MTLRRINPRLITLLLATGLIGVAAACSSATADPLGGDTTKNSTTKRDSGTSGTSSGGEPTEDDDAGSTTRNPSNPNTCATKTTDFECAVCCGYSEALFAAADEAFGACACQTETDCKAECGATFCNDQEPSAACDTCLTQKCDPKGAAACEANAACKAFETCEKAAGCRDKPEPDAG